MMTIDQGLDFLFGEPDWEQYVLGAMLIERNAIEIAMDEETHSDLFHDPVHRRIFLAIRSLFHHGVPVDILTVQEELKRQTPIEQISTAYLVELCDSVPTAANIEFYLAQLYERMKE